MIACVLKKLDLPYTPMVLFAADMLAACDKSTCEPLRHCESLCAQEDLMCRVRLYYIDLKPWPSNRPMGAGFSLQHSPTLLALRTLMLDQLDSGDATLFSSSIELAIAQPGIHYFISVINLAGCAKPGFAQPLCIIEISKLA